MGDWNEKNYVRVYQLARDGLDEEEIAKALGVDLKTFRSWRRRKPALGEAFRTGRSIGQRETVMKRVDGLSDMQRQFVHEYLVDLNGTKAAERAGYSKKTAASQAVANMKKPLVQKAIFREMQERMHRTDIEADRVLRELSYVAFADPKDLFDEEGILKDLIKMPDPIRRSIQAMDVSPSGRVRLKFWDKVSALTLLMRHLGLIEANRHMNESHRHEHLHLETQDNPYLKLSGDALIEVKKTLDRVTSNEDILEAG